MAWKTAVAGVAVLFVVLAGVGAAFVFGVGPAPGGDDAELTDFPTATPASSGDGGAAGTATAASTPPFDFGIERIERCGRTCRDVTVSLSNLQREAAEDVTVYTRMYAGQDNTAEEDLVWSGKEAVGTLEAGGTHTATKRVELSLSEGLTVENRDGWVTVLTTVQTADRTVTYRESRQVA